MVPHKPQPTAADFMVIALSPALIMVLVGSLCFFLLEVLYRGQTVGTVRWVMFWFVLGIVLVARIAIEKTSENAALYGLGLAGAVSIYLLRRQPAYGLSIPLLALVWFCAHKLVWDCTLIDDEEDASGQGLLQKSPPQKGQTGLSALPAGKGAQGKPKRKRVASGSPGRWVIYFSVAALPLFGVGQGLLAAAAAGSRRMGLVCVVLYMGAALGLLLTTSFLGLRRYLRQRYLRMPAAIARSWLNLGGGVALAILAGALLLPRPGAGQVWASLRYRVDYQLRQASRYATRNNPPGHGEQGRAGKDTGGQRGEGKTPEAQPNSQTAPAESGKPSSSQAPQPGTMPSGAAEGAYRFLRAALLTAAALFAAWWLFRCRFILWEIARSFVDFFRRFLDMMPARRPQRPQPPDAPRPHIRPLSDYKNPFLADAGHSRPPSEIILYTYEAVQAWAREQGIELHPEQTAREFCREMASRSPELAGEYQQLSRLHAHAAYGVGVPAHCDMEPLKELWRQLTWTQANAPVARSSLPLS